MQELVTPLRSRFSYCEWAKINHFVKRFSDTEIHIFAPTGLNKIARGELYSVNPWLSHQETRPQRGRTTVWIVAPLQGADGLTPIFQGFREYALPLAILFTPVGGRYISEQKR